MDDGAKKGLAKCKKLIQEGKHGEALDDLEVMGYKYSKVPQVHLMMGFCYQKLNRPVDAEKAYLQVLDINPQDSNALKQLCEIYAHRGDFQKGTKYLQQMAAICKNTDPKKYREVVVKLISLFQKECNMEKIDPVFQEYSATEESIGEDFVQIAKSYFRVGVTNQCFSLQKFQLMGMKGDQIRPIIPAAKEEMNRLMIDVIQYMKAVSLTYNLSKRDIANSIMQLKMYFPECASLLMMLLFDQYCVGQMVYSSYILGQLYNLCQGHFDDVNNYYHNLRYTSPEIFSVCMLLAKEYLCFFKQFFTLEEELDKYYPKLTGIQDQLENATIREDYRKNIDKFILKECRQLSELSKRQNIEVKLTFMKERIEALEDSYLEEVIAKIALHSFTNYDQLNDMKYKLKVRIKQLTPDIISPHLYKYYYDYVTKMAKVFKTLDQEIPIKEVLTYITVHDPKDHKYQLQLIWFDFCMSVKEVPEQSKKEVSQNAIRKIKEIENQLQFSSKSSALRIIMILKIFGGDYEVEEIVKAALQHERSFENLQCASFFYYQKGHHKEALTYLRQAYQLNQNHYHTNRLFFLTLYRCGDLKEAFAFLEHVHQTFNGVFWVNYFLGINRSKHHQFLEAESCIVKALQAFQAGSVDNFRFYYEKVHDIGSFSMLHLVKQNQYSIFFDELLLSEEFIYKELPALSNLYFTRQIEVSRMKLYLKEGELLKILGRTKSSLNYLQDAYNQSIKVELNEQSSVKSLFDHALLRKQYATLLFYSCQLKEAEDMLYSSYTIIKTMLSIQEWPLALKINEEVQALFFEISISRLAVMMKFQSQECIADYLSRFKESMMNPVKPSLTFLKNKYQFNILQFMHERKNSEKVEASVIAFLAYFELKFEDRLTEAFANKLQEFDQPERKFIRECLEDYYIVRGLSKSPSEDEILHILSLFPKSSTLCVIFGSVTENMKLKTASFLKVIQLDKESTISMDILASLYLKQKNYLAAAKLFLKSLETDVLNSKCYIGLAICLFCLIVRAVEEGEKSQIDIISQCLVRINSYMEFIKLNDPFENYHLLQFLKLLLSDEAKGHFENKLVLQSAQRNCYRYRQTLLGQLLNQTSKYWKELNFWRSDHHYSIVSSFLEGELQKGLNDHKQTSLLLAKKAQKQSEQLRLDSGNIRKEICLKKFDKTLHQLGLSVCLALKSQTREKDLLVCLISACNGWQNAFTACGFSSSLLVDLKQKVKSYLYDYVLLGDWESEMVKSVDCVFADVASYDHLIKHYKKIPKFEREIARQLMLNPGNQQIREIYTGYQVSQKGWNVRKAKLSHRLELQNSNNINTTEDAHTYKQLSLLYRDPQAIILSVSSQWSNCGLRSLSNVKKWVNLIDYIIKKKQVQESSNMLEKGRRMKLEMIAYLQVRFEHKVNLKLDNYQEQKLKKLVSVFSIMNKLQKKEKVTEGFKTLGQLFKGQGDDFDWWILMTLINYVTRRIQTSPRIEFILESLQNKVEGKLKAFVLLVFFLVVMKKNTESEAGLVEQIVKLTELSSLSLGVVSPSTEVILECSRCHSAGSWVDIQEELTKAAETIRVTSYSDQVLVNFFQLLKEYKAAETNPNGEGVIQAFLYLADGMLNLIKEPLLRGFVLSLKGMVMSMMEGEGRSIKMAMILSPFAAKGLLSQSQ